MRIKVGLRNTLRRRLIVAGLLFIFTATGLTFLIIHYDTRSANAATVGDIRSIGSGSWTNLALWQRFDGTNWVAATAVPSFSDNEITICSGHTIIIAAALSVDQVVVENGAVLILNPAITLTLKKLAIPDMKVYGIFRNAGLLSIAGGTSITYYNGGKYQHNYTTTAGTIPAGIWNDGSVCEIMGYTSNTLIPTGLNQTFSELVWNCTSQAGNIAFAGGLTTFNGSFTVQSTNGKELQLAANNYTFNLTGNLTINGGTMVFNTAASKTTALNLTGNMYINGGILNYTTGNINTGTINLNGNLYVSSGTFNFGVGNNSITTMNLSGNFYQTGGTLMSSGTGTATGKITFNKTGTQSFNYSAGAVTGPVDYIVNSGSTLNIGTSTVIGNNFTLNSGGEIGIGSPDGITGSGATGNIQVTGTRTFNSGGYYLYNGTSDQVTGNGLPSSVTKITINNGANLTLTGTTTITGTLNLMSGKILTPSNELIVTNTAAAAISGSSNNSYVAGNLRRTISATGTFSFPVGSLTKYESLTVQTTGMTGTTNILASFSNATVVTTANPVTVVLKGVTIKEMLDYGYWTLTPNLSPIAGSYAVTLNEQGFSNAVVSSTYFGVLSRTTSSNAWQSVGTHYDSTQSVNGSVVTAVRSGLTSFYQFGIGVGDFLAFSNPSIISGDSGQVGVIYLFPNIMRGIDGWISIEKIYNGAVLSDIDNSGTGYNDAFQPFIEFPANKESYIEWKILFKIAGTATDTTLEKVEATGVDVDGNYYNDTIYLREFIVATMPTYYSLDLSSGITMSNDSGRYKALGPVYNAGNIDTSRHDAMYQLTYNNVKSVSYRTGAINRFPFPQIRQTSLYFRPFLFNTPIYALPIELKQFRAKLHGKEVQLNWITATEVNNDFFTIERSSDGENFEPILTVKGAGNSSTDRSYEATDPDPLSGTSYYRLRQTDYDGKSTVSNIEAVKFTETISGLNIFPNPFENQFQVDFNSSNDMNGEINLTDIGGKLIRHESISISKGTVQYSFQFDNDLPAGIYYLTLIQGEQKISKKIVKL
jgi:hypothetical protein